MLARAWKLVRTAKRSLTLIATILGVIYIPPNIQGLAAAYGFAWEIPQWLDSERAAYVSLAIACAWIFWMDIRPLVTEWWQRNQGSSTFAIEDHVHCEAHHLVVPEGEEGPNFYRNVFYLAIRNDLATGDVFRRVQARIVHHGPPTLCRIKDVDAGEIDIRHGEWGFFEIGSLVSPEFMGLVCPPSVRVEDNHWQMYTHNVPRGYLSYEVRSAHGRREFGLGFDQARPNVWALVVVVSADDVKSMVVKLSIDLSKKRDPVSFEVTH